MARKVKLAQAKAKKIAHEGFTRLGGGFDSEKQRRYIGWVAGGRKKPKHRSKPSY